MGMYDSVLIDCFLCGKETLAQTKILGCNNLETFKIGSDIYGKEFFNCVLNLKNKCEKCGKDTAIIIKDGKIIGTENPKYANCIEGHFGQCEWVDELEQIVAEKLKMIEKKNG